MSMPAVSAVRHVRVQGSDIDPLTARLRLEHMLAVAALHPPGMPASAILCVRRLTDPLPGKLALERPETSLPAAWERALVGRLERLYRTAGRPAHESVAESTEAVLFLDHAELLACLARDRLAGLAWNRWWWHWLPARARPGRDLVGSTWLDAPEYVPAAFELLAARGAAVRFAASLAPPSAAELTARVARVHGLSIARQMQRSAAAISTTPATSRLARNAGIAARPPAWSDVVPETTTQEAPRALAPEQELLLVVSLALRRAPWLARSPAFAAYLAVWVARPRRPTDVERPRIPRRTSKRDAAQPEMALATAVAQSPDGGARDFPSTIAAPIPQPSAVASRRAPQLGHDGLRPLVTPGAEQAPPRPVPRDPPRSVVISAPSELPPARLSASPPPPAPVTFPQDPPPRTGRRPHRLPSSTTARRRPVASGAASSSRPTPGGPSTRPAPGADPRASADLRPATVATAFGGLFYLLNLLTALGLYADFTTPDEPGIALDPWDCVALLGRALIGRPVPHDPIWTVLGGLAGRRQGERSVPGFRPPQAWRVPARWLEPFEHGGTWRWSAADGAVRIFHPAGFPAVAVPRSAGAPGVQLRRELSRLARVLGAPAPAPVRTALPREPARPLARWVARLAGYARARLASALGVSDSAAAVELVLAHRAEVLVTPTHVDLWLSLAELPLAIRFAGLDRDPGWIPAAGRFLAFHFS